MLPKIHFESCKARSLYNRYNLIKQGTVQRPQLDQDPVKVTELKIVLRLASLHHDAFGYQS